MIHFFSNHKDVAELEKLTGEKIEVIAHPYIEPEWSFEEVELRCAVAIQRALDADRLILNGDYTIFFIIAVRRAKMGKPTGFVGFKKLNAPSNEKDADGNIVHRNVLRPVRIRWTPPDYLKPVQGKKT